MLKRVLLSLALLAVAGTVAVGATRALVSNSVTLTGNSYSVGSVDLQIALDSTGWLETVPGFTETLLPGQTDTNYVWLRNNTADASLTTAAQATPVGGTLSPADVTVTFTPVDAFGVPTGDAATTATLDVWNTSAQGLNPTLAPGASQRYEMKVTIDSGVSVSGADSTFDFVFTGTQVL